MVEVPEIWQKAIVTVVTALGGPSAIIGAIRSARSLKTFRSEMREGIREVRSGVRRLSAELRADADNDPSPTFYVDAGGAVEWANQAFAERLGWSRDEMLGAGWLNAIHPCDRQQVADEWSHAVKAERYFSIAARTQHRDGRVRSHVVTIRLLPKRCHDGEFYGWRGTFFMTEDQAAA